MAHWLMKSEPDVFSFADLMACPNATEPWDGIRNYQARNFIRDTMQIGDGVLFYHSRTDVPGVVGLARIASDAYPDPTQFDPSSKYFDAKSPEGNPRWLLVDVQGVEAFKDIVSLAAMKDDPALEGMLVTKRGQRLSIQPVEAEHFEHVCKLGGVKA